MFKRVLSTAVLACSLCLAASAQSRQITNFDADWKLLENVCNNTNIKVIGNNSIDSPQKIRKMYECGVYGFSIARGVISGTLNFDIANF